MIVVDVNLLLYAVIDGFPEHASARDWWEETLNSTIEVGLCHLSAFGFLRISTSARFLTAPLSVDAAVGHVNQWLEQPGVRLLTPGPRHLDIAVDLLRTAGTGGNLTTDAQLAALAIEHDAELCSNDSDFAKFAGVRWVNPLGR